MPVRKAHATWNGPVETGTGSMSVESGVMDRKFSAGTRMENEPGTNPEELIGAAHAGCFSMALSLMLGEEGYEDPSIATDAEVTFGPEGEGFAIKKVRLSTVGRVEGMDEGAFRDLAMKAKAGCPVSKALTGVEIELEAKLEN
jgi:osmotically inducible protein OsmC